MQRKRGKGPHPLDTYIGGRVRVRRMMLGMSQNKLATKIGVAFQQVQKYEKGENRIGAGRLWDISRVLEVPVSFFYEELRQSDSPDDIDGVSESERPEIFYPPEEVAQISNFLASREGYQLMSSFVSIESPILRKRIIDLVRAVSSGDESSD